MFVQYPAGNRPTTASCHLSATGLLTFTSKAADVMALDKFSHASLWFDSESKSFGLRLHDRQAPHALKLFTRSSGQLAVCAVGFAKRWGLAAGRYLPRWDEAAQLWICDWEAGQ
jgi:hypothetical protein